MNITLLKTGRRVISGIVAFMMATTPFAGVKSGKTVSEKDTAVGGVKTVTVSADGEYKTLDAARDYVRTLDKSQYTGIEIVLTDDEYLLTEAFTLTEEDAGTETCPITYKSENGAVISGGIAFDSSAFTAKFGDVAQYFKADAKNNIAAIDLKQLGYTAEDIAAMYTDPETGKAVQNIDYGLPRLYVNGAMATIARYPNDGYASFETGKVLCEGGAKNAIDRVTETEIVLNDEDAAVVAGWHDLSKVFVKGRFALLWCNDNSRINAFDGKTLLLPFAGGYDPLDGMFLHFENIPEELDAPNEYYIDDNAILYLVKCEDFENASFTISYAESLLDVDGADYLTFDGIVFESTSGNILDVKADYFTLVNCELRDAMERAVIEGNHVTVDSCVFHDFANAVLDVIGGDWEKLTYSDNLITNSEFYDWALVGKVYNSAITVEGVGATVSHNLLHDAPHMAIGWEGNFHTVEYNEIYNVCNDTDDAAAIYAYNSYVHYGNVFRYNYIHDIGLQDEALKNIKNYPYCNVTGIYFDGGKSGQSAIGNVFENISGAAVIASGRDEVVTNNVFVSCGYGVDMSAWYYSAYMDGRGGAGGKSNQGFNKVENYDAWKKTFPSLFSFIWDDTDEAVGNPNFYIAPAGNVAKDNYYFLDKVTCSTMKGYGHLLSMCISSYVREFCGDNIEEAVEGVNQTTYSSKRNPISAAEAVEKAQSVTGVTPEMFAEMGLLK